MSAPLLSEAAARARTDEIHAAITTIMNDQKVTMELLEAAARDGVHHALGYDTFPEYVDQEFRLALSPADARARKNIVLRLRQLGLSTRTIAEVVGASQSTVSRDVRAGESDDSPVRGRDGKLYSPVRNKVGRSARVKTPVTEQVSEGVTPFELSYYAAVHTVAVGVRALVALHEDDRFGEHRERIAAHHRTLDRKSEVLQRLGTELRGPTSSQSFRRAA